MQSKIDNMTEGKSPSVRRIRVPEEPLYLFAILLMAFGIAMTARGGLGLSMVTAPAYILAEALGLTFGTVEYLLQGVLLIVISALLRRPRLPYLLTFAAAFLEGIAIDGMGLLLAGLPADTLPLRILWFAIGAAVTALSVALFFRIYLPPMAYDLFVRDLSRGFGIGQGRFKLAYDISSALLAVLLSFLFFGFGSFYGIGVGTVVLALVNGPVIVAFGRLFDRFFEPYALLPIKKYFE